MQVPLSLRALDDGDEYFCLHVQTLALHFFCHVLFHAKKNGRARLAGFSEVHGVPFALSTSEGPFFCPFVQAVCLVRDRSTREMNKKDPLLSLLYILTLL